MFLQRHDGSSKTGGEVKETEKDWWMGQRGIEGRQKQVGRWGRKGLVTKAPQLL